MTRAEGSGPVTGQLRWCWRGLSGLRAAGAPCGVTAVRGETVVAAAAAGSVMLVVLAVADGAS